MKIFKGKNENGKLVYIEISNFFLSKSSFIECIQKMKDVNNITITANQDIFCTFDFNDKEFEIMESFGDSSLFHISEKTAKSSKEIETLYLNFLKH